MREFDQIDGTRQRLCILKVGGRDMFFLDLNRVFAMSLMALAISGCSAGLHSADSTTTSSLASVCFLHNQQTQVELQNLIKANCLVIQTDVDSKITIKSPQPIVIPANVNIVFETGSQWIISAGTEIQVSWRLQHPSGSSGVLSGPRPHCDHLLLRRNIVPVRSESCLSRMVRSNRQRRTR